MFHSIDEEYPANQDIVCQYIRPDGWQENHKDHICLFKVGWVTKNDAIFMVSLPAPSKDPIGRVLIPGLPLLHYLSPSFVLQFFQNLSLFFLSLFYLFPLICSGYFAQRHNKSVSVLLHAWIHSAWSKHPFPVHSPKLQAQQYHQWSISRANCERQWIFSKLFRKGAVLYLYWCWVPAEVMCKDLFKSQIPIADTQSCCFNGKVISRNRQSIARWKSLQRKPFNIM